MTPELKRQVTSMLEGLRYEAGSFAKRAADKRRLAIELRKQRRWLEALEADSRAAEYRRTRDNRAAAAKKLKATYGLR